MASWKEREGHCPKQRDGGRISDPTPGICFCFLFFGFSFEKEKKNQ